MTAFDRLSLESLRVKYHAALNVLFKSLEPEKRQIAIAEIAEMRAELTRRGEGWE